MRDALSILDQAIASAPVEFVQGAGRPVLSAAQIRELMGAVPNAVFERLLEAVAAGQSAELMEQLNLLVNAGHSSSSLARQMARYLRNSLMAKLGGEHTELLQISGDERARAARTALLFTEEELTRNLQIVLRTFDDLNFRQEQRFHLELGLLKLIHAQRLLPLEELLSAVAVGGGFRSAAASASAPGSAPRPSASPTRPLASSASPAAPPLSPFSPAGGSWGSGAKMESGFTPGSSNSPAATIERASSAAVANGPAALSSFQSATPFPATTAQPAGFASTEALTEGALAKAPQTAVAAASLPGIEQIRYAVGCALVEGGHESAAQLLGAGGWTVDGSSLRIEVAGLGKKMLALTVNPAAEKIIRQELQRLGAPTRFLVVPGEGAAQNAAPVAAPLAGSIQEAALGNPLVQRAREIFKAEVRSVVDLRQK
jgi:DNA polymerase-3 subunit gamma/tau